MKKFKDYIIYMVRILRKHGWFGRRRQITYLFAGYIDVAQYKKNISSGEMRQFYQSICKQYTEIRVHALRADRIGENVPRYLAGAEDARRNAENGILDIFVLANFVNFNGRVLDIEKRNIHIVDETNIALWTYVLSRFPKVEFKKYVQDYRDRVNGRNVEPESTMQYMALSREEEEEAKQKKKAMNLQGVYVCASNRDSTYLSTTRPEHDWTYHDYRDTDVNSLCLAADYLSKEEIIMVRMGRYVQNEVQFDNCIDYANKYYDELMDIALMRDCKFYVGDSCGINILPMTLNIPCAFKNVTPAFRDAWGSMPQNPHNLFIFKKHYSIIEKRFLTIREMMEVEKQCGALGHKYAEAQIKMVENSAEEVLDLVREMNERIDGKWVDSEEDIELQKRYTDIYRCWCEQEHYDSQATFHAKVGALFLRKNAFLLE